MTDLQPFTEFLRRVRAGDDDAAEELVRRYEPLIRREIRVRIDGRLHRAFDSVDVSQSVLVSFFVRAANGQYDLDNPGQLVKLLVAMARNKVASRARRERQQRRDVRRVGSGNPDALGQVADPQLTPSELLSRRELIERLRTALSDEERRIAELRSQGFSWDEVAQTMGGTSQSRRMQLVRGVGRAGRALGLDE